MKVVLRNGEIREGSFEEKEQEAGTVSVRQRDAEADKQDMGQLSVEEFVTLLYTN